MNDFKKTSPASLARMLDVEQDATLEWSEPELADMLAHQLGAPIEPDLKMLSDDASRVLKRLGPEAIDMKFEDLLHAAHPSLELLELSRQLGKQYRGQGAGPMQKVATVLYYASILVARARLQKRITELSDGQIRQGAQWVLQQPWIDARTRELFEKNVGALSA